MKKGDTVRQRKSKREIEKEKMENCTQYTHTGNTHTEGKTGGRQKRRQSGLWWWWLCCCGSLAVAGVQGKEIYACVCKGCAVLIVAVHMIFRWFFFSSEASTSCAGCCGLLG